jgi:hypothetical protein
MAIRACMPVINSCRSVTLGLTEGDVSIANLDDVFDWLDAGIATNYRAVCEGTGGVWSGAPDGECTCSGSGGLTQDSSKRFCVCPEGKTLKLDDEGAGSCEAPETTANNG